MLPFNPARFSRNALYGSGGTPFSMAFVSSNSNAAGASPFTFSSQNIGTADATRIVVVAIMHGPNGVAITNVTIGGVTATQAPGADSTTANAERLDIWYLAVPTGSTANIVVTCATESRMAIGVFNVFGSTAAFSSAQKVASGSAVTLSAPAITVPVGGGVIAIGSNHNAANTITASNYTEDVTNLVVGASVTSMGRDTSHSGSTVYGINWSPTTTDGSFSVAAFAP